jgi:ankyrin repeat protein
MKNLEIKDTLIDLILSEDDEENTCKLNDLLDAGMNPNLSFSLDEYDSDKTLLEYCCRFGLISYVNSLIKHNVKLDIFTEDNETPLHLLAYNILNIDSKDSGNDVYNEIIKKIKHLINHQDKEGRTPLMLAVKSGDIDKANLLIDNGADISIIDCFGNNCLHFCFMENHPINLQLDLINLLIEKNADSSLTNKLGMSPIDYYLKLHPPLSQTPFSKKIRQI